ncbi:hypothetical protein HDU86_007270 [Geranomyces michiganensis]|nr:hypothetical protein HDU86_007270 [Geranomyces michiganensis]
MALGVSFAPHGSSSRKLYGRFSLIALALLAQLVVLLVLSYRPNALTQVVNNNNNNNNHFWSSRPAVPPYIPESFNNQPIIASDSPEETGSHAIATSGTTGAQTGGGFKKRPTSKKKRPPTDVVSAKPPLKAAAGRKKTLPTNIRNRPWTNPATAAPLLATRLCGDDGRLPDAADLAPIAATTAGGTHGAGALVFPGVTRAHLVPGTHKSREPKIRLRSRDSVCAWLVVVDYGDSAAATPWYQNRTSAPGASNGIQDKNLAGNSESSHDNNRKRAGDGPEKGNGDVNGDDGSGDENEGDGASSGIGNDGNSDLDDNADSNGSSDSSDIADSNGSNESNDSGGGSNGTASSDDNPAGNGNGNSISNGDSNSDATANNGNGNGGNSENSDGNSNNSNSSNNGNVLATSPPPAESNDLPPLTFPPVAVGWPPDSVDLLAEGENYTVAFDSSHQYVIVNGRDSEVSYRIYNVTLDLRDPDAYQLHVLLECECAALSSTTISSCSLLILFSRPWLVLADTDYLWNYEDPAHVYWDPTPLPIFMNRDSLTLLPSTLRLLANDPLTHPQITYQSFSELPLCSNGNHPGRWVPSTHLGPTPSVRMHVPSDMDESSTIDYDQTPLLLQNYDDAVWVPYDCRYQARTYDAWRDRCLLKHHPYVHYFGDSNIRRALKTLASGGRWCKVWYNEESSACQCTDWHLHIEGLAPDREDNLLRILSADDARNSPPDESSPPPPTPVAYAFLWKGLNSWGPNWTAGVDLTSQQQRLTHILPGAAQLAQHAPTAAIISLTNWDAAYGSFAEFERSLPVLVERLRETYVSRGVPIVWRAGQHFAGRADHVDAEGAAEGKKARRFSRARVRAFDAAAERALVGGLGAAAWDVRAIGAALRPQGRARAAQCDSGHAGRDLIDTENTVLMNVLCNP